MDQDLDKQLNVTRLIVVAMAAGLVVFGIVTLVIGPRMEDPEFAKILLLMLVALGLSESVAYGVLRTVTLNALRKDVSGLPLPEAEQKAMGSYHTLVVIRSAMAEGLGLFGVTIAMVTGAKLAFAAPLLSLILLAIGFPTRQKLSDLVTAVTGRNPYAA